MTPIQGPDYHLIRSADPCFVDSYANYYVCNGAVISANNSTSTPSEKAAAASTASPNNNHPLKS